MSSDIGKIVGTIATGGLLAAVPGVFYGNQKQQSPTVLQPQAMPQADSEAVNTARQKAATALQLQRGRASTMLSGNNDPLGG